MADDLPNLKNARYSLTKKLGEGGQAASFEAVDKRAGRLVVIKRFRVRGAASWKEVELAEREARVLASLDHPNLPRYVEHFEEEGELFLVTEKIEGESLLERRSRGGSFSIAEVERFLDDARAALDYLHGRAPAVVHRDIKPSNVIARPDGSFCLIDFGAVRDRLRPEGGSTVVGTFGYMAPEQFQARAMPASDVYAAGVTALVMLTGTEPEDLPHRGLGLDVEAALGRSRVPKSLVRALAKMLEPDPEKRVARIPKLDASGSASEPAPRAKGDERWASDFGEQLQRRIKDEIRQKLQKQGERLEARVREHERKRSSREQRRERRAMRWQNRGRGGVPMFLWGPALLGLVVAFVAVTFALRVALPFVLTVLSVIFGRSLREAARTVSTAGKRAGVSIVQARRVVMSQVEAHEKGEAEAPRAGVRVAPDRARVKTTDPDRDADAEIEAEAEREADEAVRRAGRR